MRRLSFDEIKDWRQFEALAAGYLKSLPEIRGSHVKFVEVHPSGIGPDGGVDLKVHISLDDGIRLVKRTYIVQCKFHESNIGHYDLRGRSITDLVVAHKACGYLLICKKMATSDLKDHFSKLSDNERRHVYEIWSGEDFLFRLQKAPVVLLRQFFPGSFKNL
jgi:hypothetical protein